MPVTADKLPLLLARKISEQPPANALPLTLERKLGDAVIYVSAKALPLLLARQQSDRPASNQLPLPLNRLLGTLSDSIPTAKPPPPPRRMQGVFNWVNSSISPAVPVTYHQTSTHPSQLIAHAQPAVLTRVLTVANSNQLTLQNFVRLNSSAVTRLSPVYAVFNCQLNLVKAFVPLAQCRSNNLTPTIGYQQCVHNYNANVVQHSHCPTLPLQPVINYQSASSHSVASGHLSTNNRTRVQAAVPVPCRYYPIPEPPPPKPEFVCRIRPPSSQLALSLSRRRLNLPASSLPMPLMCWHDEPPRIIPSLRSYIVHNIVTATLAGIAINPITFDIKADMSGFCWSGSIDITAKDYTKIKAKLEVPKGSEPLIIVTVNNKQFSFIAEQHSRSRQFVNHSHKLSGRSITARLGTDYAKAQGGNGKGLLTQANYASQIVNQQLNGLSVSLAEFAVTDWLIPANTYAVTGKTPLAVISDIAEACGGFIVSDLSEATLSIKPRWRVPAWELATATADVTLPWIGKQIDDQLSSQPRYNTVTLTGNTDGGIVYRSQQGRDLDAPTQSNALYTAREVIVPAGTAILSDSGNHRHYTLTLRQADKYDIPLANLGDIWQINDPEGFWRGVVTGVSFGVKRDNKAPVVWQTLIIDRYVDV